MDVRFGKPSYRHSLLDSELNAISASIPNFRTEAHKWISNFRLEEMRNGSLEGMSPLIPVWHWQDAERVFRALVLENELGEKLS